MNADKSGGPAFPTKANNTDKFEGMSLRDYFAAAALQGKAGYRSLTTVEEMEKAALECYSMADAMIVERNKP